MAFDFYLAKYRIYHFQEGRQEMLTKADQLLATISMRREKVNIMII